MENKVDALEPLIRAIAFGDAVIFVGAGVSMDAGLPNWKQFLKECCDAARGNAIDQPDVQFVENMIDGGEFLLAAEILQNMLRSDLPHLIRERFASEHLRPTEIHKAVASMQLPLVITTNYDRLMELAYPQTAQTLSWQRGEDILIFMKERKFGVVKIHGDVANQSSLVLTRTNYRELIHLNSSFKACMKTLLLTKTFFFIGCSLRDHDVLNQIEEAKSEFDSGFGPHFAIMLKSEVNDSLKRAMRDCYNIEVIPIDADQEMICRLSKKPTPRKLISSLIATKITEISGRVAREKICHGINTTVFDSLFSLRRAVNSISSEVAKICGAQRVEVCFVEASEAPRKALYRFSLFSISEGATRFFDPPNLFGPDTIQGRLFLQRKIENDYVYISDLRNQGVELDDQGYEGLRNEKIHDDSESLLACPIYGDGRRVGVLTVEAERKRAFDDNHLFALKRLARELGWAEFEARQRLKASKPLMNYAELRQMLNQSRLLRELKLEYLLYEIDSFQGRLVAHHERISNGDVPELSFDFSETSLARSVLAKRRKEFHRDTQEAVENGLISKSGAAHFGITGPLFGLPISCQGVTAGVLVCWSQEGPEVNQGKFEQSMERTRRMAHLVANDPPEIAASHNNEFSGENSSRLFIQAVNDTLASVDGGKPWSRWDYRSETFRTNIIEGLLKNLLHESCGLYRLRLWLKTSGVDQVDSSVPAGFSCSYSYSRGKPGKDPKVEANHIGLQIQIDDPYADYISIRARFDPYARLLDHSMLGDQEETVSKQLGKCPGAPWIVAPVIRGDEMIGFVAADTHYFDSKSGTPAYEAIPEVVNVFQRYCVDATTDILASVLKVQLGQMNCGKERKKTKKTKKTKKKN